MPDTVDDCSETASALDHLTEYFVMWISEAAEAIARMASVIAESVGSSMSPIFTMLKSAEAKHSHKVTKARRRSRRNNAHRKRFRHGRQQRTRVRC